MKMLIISLSLFISGLCVSQIPKDLVKERLKFLIGQHRSQKSSSNQKVFQSATESKLALDSIVSYKYYLGDLYSNGVQYFKYSTDGNLSSWILEYYEYGERMYLEINIESSENKIEETWYTNRDNSPDSEIILVGICTYTFDSSGNLIELLSKSKKNDSNNFSFRSRTTMTYDTNNKMVKEIKEDYQDSLLVGNIEESTFKYNGLNQLVLKSTNCSSSDSLKTIYFNQMEEYFYNESGKLVKALTSTKKDQGWVISKVISNDYLNSNLVRTTVSDTQIYSKMTPFSKDEFFYDENSKLVSVQSYFWAADSSLWEKSSSSSYKMNENKNLNPVCFPLSLLDPESMQFPNNKVGINYDAVKACINKDCSIYEESKFYYSELIINSVPNVSKKIRGKIYPNPATNNLIFNIEADNKVQTYQVEIYNILGLLVYSGNMTSGVIEQVNMSKLEAGVYFIKLNDGHQTLVEQILKQ